jgi:hypothetical protein
MPDLPMSGPFPPAMIKELRQLLASAIADAKAYDVPALCRRLNLGDGEEQEAFASKYKYAHRRLVEVSSKQVVASARQLLAEEQHFDLGEQLARIDEWSSPAVTTLTRRRLIALFAEILLSREIDEVEPVRGLWPIGSCRAPPTSDELSLEEFLRRQAFVNDRLMPQDLETLGLLTCSRAQLFRSLESVTAPEARTGPEQNSPRKSTRCCDTMATRSCCRPDLGQSVLCGAVGAGRVPRRRKYFCGVGCFRSDAGARALDRGHGAARLGARRRDHAGPHAA